MHEDDARRAGPDTWLDYLAGKSPDYPERALRADLGRVRQRVAGMRQDPTTPDTRLSDDPMRYNPASVSSLLELAMGGIHPGRGGNTLTARLRYFDADARRPGLPPDVAALVTRLTADEADVTLVNVNQLATRTLIVQGGAYGEHTIVSVAGGGNTPVGSRLFAVRLGPGAGGTLRIRFQRHANPPTLALPWSP
jgi:hypothetical protein